MSGAAAWTSSRNAWAWGIERHVPVLQGEIHRRPVERGELGPCVTHQDVQRAELALDVVEQSADLLGTCHVGLHDKPISAARPDFRQGLIGSFLLRVIVYGSLDAVLCQLQRDPPANTTRASGDESTFLTERHMHLLPKRVFDARSALKRA
jgi:hypothetical protein